MIEHGVNAEKVEPEGSQVERKTMIKMNKRMLALVLACALITMLIGSLPTTAGAATGPVTIDITLNTGSIGNGASPMNNSAASATDSQWRYDPDLLGSGPELVLDTPGGVYTLTGTNTNLAIKVNGTNMDITLDNLNVANTSGFAPLDLASSTVTLVGANAVGRGASLMNCIVTGSGTLLVTATLYNPGISTYDSGLTITGNADVTARGNENFAINMYSGNTITLGDNASLGMDNDHTSDETHTFVSEPGSTYRWVLTGSAVLASGSLTDPSIEVTIPAGTGGRVAREPIPVAPAITSPNTLSVVAGTGGSLLLTATGTPAPTWSLSGAPAGVSITGSTLNVASTVPAGTYTFTITAANGAEPDATQSFTLTVTKAGGGNGGGDNGGGTKPVPPTGDALSLLAPLALLISSLASLSLASDQKKRH